MATSKDLLQLKGNDNMLLVVGQKKKMPESLKTFQVPPSSVLQQARCFLPQLASANAALQEKLMTIPAAQLDIENIDDCHGDIIEMNFAVVENEDSDSCDSSSVSDSDCEDSDEDHPLFLDHLTPENINIKKPDRRTKRPTIEMMTDFQKSSDTDVSETSTNDIQKVVPEERQHTIDTVTDSERLTDDGLWE
ncbi:hypothetical protein LSAT2_024562 [Lamellibrachia satsuma]|nr:hypothetical protein LSAT2_024562 [Lamellibrachia satsuma]